MPSKQSPKGLNELLEQARALHAEGRTRAAIDMLETAEHALQTSRLWALVAHFHYMLQEYDSAGIAARKALESDPGNRLALQTAGELQLRGSNFEHAEVYFKEAIAAGSPSVHPYLRLAFIYTSQLFFNRAVDILNQGLEKHTGNADLLERLQFALTMDGRIEEAATIRKNRLRSNADSSSPDIKTLINRFEGLERDHAIKQLKLLASMEHYSNEPELHHQVARLLMDAQRYAEAIPHLETVTRLRDRNDNARLNLAVCLYKSGEANRGDELLEPMERYRHDLAFRIVKIEGLIAGNRQQEALDLCMELLQSHPRDKRLRRLLQQLKRSGIRPSAKKDASS